MLRSPLPPLVALKHHQNFHQSGHRPTSPQSGHWATQQIADREDAKSDTFRICSRTIGSSPLKSGMIPDTSTPWYREPFSRPLRILLERLFPLFSKISWSKHATWITFFEAQHLVWPPISWSPQATTCPSALSPAKAKRAAQSRQMSKSWSWTSMVSQPCHAGDRTKCQPFSDNELFEEEHLKRKKIFKKK